MSALRRLVTSRGGFSVAGQPAQPGHDLRAAEQRGAAGQRQRGIPVVKTVSWMPGEKARQQFGGGGVEGLVVARRLFRRGLQSRLEFRHTAGDRRADLFGEVQVATGRVGEKGVDEVQAPDFVARAFGGRHLRPGACAQER